MCLCANGMDLRGPRTVATAFACVVLLGAPSVRADGPNLVNNGEFNSGITDETWTFSKTGGADGTAAVVGGSLLSGTYSARIQASGTSTSTEQFVALNQKLPSEPPDQYRYQHQFFRLRLQAKASAPRFRLQVVIRNHDSATNNWSPLAIANLDLSTTAIPMRPRRRSRSRSSMPCWGS